MPEQNKPNILRLAIQLIVVIVIVPLLPVLVSGDWGWWQGWAFAAATILSFVISRLIVYRVHPDLIRERARFMEAQDTKPWDRILAPMLAFGSILVAVAAGLDHLRARAFVLPEYAYVIWLVCIIAGYAFSSWALIENRFFSGTVRIQTERGHHVVATGPYRFIRHPGYAGALFGYLFVPFLLDSLWALVPTVLLFFVLFVRTALEDKTLHAELPGYAEYAKKTRYRLIPGVW